MQEHSPELINRPRSRSSWTVRDWVAVGFRHGRLMIVSFLTVLFGVALIAWFMPAKYEAQTKIMVRRERVDPVVSAEPGQFAIATDLTEQDVNSEVELFKSRDLLEKVVLACGLHLKSRDSVLSSLFAAARGRSQGELSADRMRVIRAVDRLQKDLEVAPLRKTKLIVVTYASHDPRLSAQVLQTLVPLYLEKHVAVHRLPGALDFFQEQTEQYRKGLINAEERLTGFGRERGVFAAPMEKEITLRKLNEFEAELRHTQAAAMETERRIRVLEKQADSAPERRTTQMRTIDNGLLLQQMKSTLLNLELKRTELLSKFEPDYRPVREVEAQIAQTRETVAREENSPMREETTDRDSTYEWAQAELAKAHTDMAALEARLAATTDAVNAYRDQARQLNQAEIAQQGLLRSVKTAEDNFLLYSRKQEEARIRDALDQQRIVNVSVAEEATVPTLPSSPSPLLSLVLGGLLASMVSVGLAFTADYLDPSFRTPYEVEAFLDIPVLAAVPRTELLQ